MSLWIDAYRTVGTYWPPVGSDGYGGDWDDEFAGSMKLLCRWEERSEDVVGKHGEVLHIWARVWTDTTLALGGYLYLGECDDASPLDVENAYKIRQVRRIGGVFDSGDAVEHCAYL